MTQEQLARLTRENRELKEMCIFLEQSREGGAGGGAGGGEDNSLTPPEMLDTMLRGRVMGEVNRRQGSIPHYVGQTRRTRLKDTQAIKRGVASEASKELALDEMRARLDRVEVERVELIKVTARLLFMSCSFSVCVCVCVLVCVVPLCGSCSCC